MALFRVKPWYRKKGPGIPSYYGVATPLTDKRSDCAATSIGNYALFGGTTTSVDAYNASLIKTAAPALRNSFQTITAARSDYAFFCYNGSSDYSGDHYIDIYDTSLTKYTNIEKPPYNIYGATAIEGYTFLLTYYGNGTTKFTSVYAYNSSLTRQSANTYSNNAVVSSFQGVMGTVGNYALVAARATNSSYYDATVYNKAFDSSLTALSSPVNPVYKDMGVATITDYVLYGGGDDTTFNGNYYTYNTVYAYSTSLTKISAPNLSSNNYGLAATSVENYALFGYGQTNNNCIDYYNNSLIKNIISNTINRTNVRATHVKNYALFGGGRTYSTYSDVVDVYQVS